MITGKRIGDFAGYWGGDHHNGVPIFVPTHQPPAENPFAQITTSPMASPPACNRPEQLPADRDVFMHGAYAASPGGA